MAFNAGRNTKFLVNEFDLSSFFNQTDINDEIGVEETTTFGDTSKTYLVTLKDGTVSVTGFWDGATDAIDEELNAILGATAGQVVSVGLTGTDVGERVELLSAKMTNYQIGSPVGGVSGIQAAFQADGGIDSGVGLHEVGAETATGNSSSVDNSASTANGGIAHLHVTSASASDTLDVKVQHSANDSTWADLTGATFTQVGSSASSERLTVATGTTVNRYIRASWTIAGSSPSYTFGVAFARR